MTIEDVIALLAILTAMSASVNRVIELMKPFIGRAADSLNIPDDIESMIVRALSVGFALVGVFGIGESVNLLAIAPGYADVAPAIGMVITAFVVAGGSNALYAIAGLLTGRPIEIDADMFDALSMDGGTRVHVGVIPEGADEETVNRALAESR